MDDNRGRDGRAFGDLRHEHLSALTPGLEEVLANSGETDEVAGFDVVVADHRKGVGDVEAEVLRGSENAQGLRVAGGEDGGRTIRMREHPRGEVARLVPSVGAESDVIVGSLDSDACERSRVSGEAVPARGNPERIVECIADEPDPPMAEVEQMLGRQRPARYVVTENAR